MGSVSTANYPSAATSEKSPQGQINALASSNEQPTYLTSTAVLAPTTPSSDLSRSMPYLYGWMLSQLDAVQHRAMNIIGPTCCLPRLELRRHVAALSFLFNLHYQPRHLILQRMLPPPNSHSILHCAPHVCNQQIPPLINTASSSPINYRSKLTAAFVVRFPLLCYHPGTTLMRASSQVSQILSKCPVLRVF